MTNATSRLSSPSQTIPAGLPLEPDQDLITGRGDRLIAEHTPNAKETT